MYIVEAVGVDANTDMSGPIGDKCSISSMRTRSKRRHSASIEGLVNHLTAWRYDATTHIPCGGVL